MAEDARIVQALGLLAKAHQAATRSAELIAEAQQALSATPSTTSVVRRLFTCYGQLWTRRYNDAYVFVGGRDGASFKRLLKTLPGEEIARRMKRFLTDNDPWLVEHKHPLPAFVKTISRYTAAEATAPGDALEAPSSCSHTPRCATDVVHTQRMLREMRRGE